MWNAGEGAGGDTRPRRPLPAVRRPTASPRLARSGCRCQSPTAPEAAQDAGYQVEPMNSSVAGESTPAAPERTVPGPSLLRRAYEQGGGFRRFAAAAPGGQVDLVRQP